MTDLEIRLECMKIAASTGNIGNFFEVYTNITGRNATLEAKITKDDPPQQTQSL